MRFRIIASSVAVILLAGSFASAGDSPDKKREKTRKMAAQTLQDLYKAQPTAQAAIQKSAGYAVFNNMGANLLLLSTARGSGIAINSFVISDHVLTFTSVASGTLWTAVGLQAGRYFVGGQRVECVFAGVAAEDCEG